MLERESGVLNDFSCHSSGSPIWELESDCRMRNYIRDNILRLYWWRLESSTSLGNAMITFFMPFDPAPCDKKSRSERFQEGLVMDEHDSSTPNKDCWHSTYRNFCKWHQAPFPILWVGPGDEAMNQGIEHVPFWCEPHHHCLLCWGDMYNSCLSQIYSQLQSWITPNLYGVLPRWSQSTLKGLC